MCSTRTTSAAATASPSCCRRRRKSAATHVAIYKIGAVALPIAVLFGPDALSYRLQNSGARALITNTQGVAKLNQIRDEVPDLSCVLSFDDRSDGAASLSDMLARASSDFTPVDTGPDDPALMIYTSGTTGQPKGALHGHRVLLGHLPGVEMPHYPFPQAGDRYWTPADWAWAGGLARRAAAEPAPRRRRWWRAKSTSSIRRMPSR